jgi:hypothetical protein
VILLAVLFLGLYVRVPLSIDSSEWSWQVEQAYRGARARGGAEFPLLFVVNYLVSLVGLSWGEVIPEDLMLFWHRGVAALGLVFFGWFLVQRFASVLVAFSGMALLGFSMVFWKGAASMNPHQLALMLFLAALCCVGRPAYGRSLSRIRDVLAIVLCTAALLSSQAFLILLPAFLQASSEEVRQRGQFLFWVVLLYAFGQAFFIYQYVIGPSELFQAATIEGKISEWLRFQPSGGGRLALDATAKAVQTELPDYSVKLMALFESAMHSIVAVGSDKLATAVLWFVVASLAVVMAAVQNVRREVMLGVLIIVPGMAVVYLGSSIRTESYLPLAVGFALIVCAPAGFIFQEFRGVLKYLGAVVLLAIVVPALAYLNFHSLMSRPYPVEETAVR